MKEVEILVEVYSTKSEVLKKLEQFKFAGVKKTADIYFYDENRENLQPKKGRLTECFRLRNKEGKYYLAYKIDNFDSKDIWTYSDEHETEVKDFECTLKIISHLGFKPLIEIKNEKQVFLTEEYEIVFEDVEGLGLFLEVESISSQEKDVTKIKENIWDFIKNLGIKTSKELNAGKPELMLRKKAFN